MEESLNFVKHGVAHATPILMIDCLGSQWHVARLPPDPTRICWAIEVNTNSFCNAKVGTSKYGIVAPTYKGLKKEFRSINNVEYEFWFCPNNIDVV